MFVFPETVFTDMDGNTVTKPSAVGIAAKAVIQPMSVSEDQGQVTEKLRMRLVGWQGGELGSASQVEWGGRKYAVDGEPKRYLGSARTARIEYFLERK